ncbi:MAG: hypothetical protein NTW46_03835 [Candidatus Nealsonbacteria bacterium]|nr:hypothetical protein [Candidatus Nealsonbacteria bacterium]
MEKKFRIIAKSSSMPLGKKKALMKKCINYLLSPPYLSRKENKGNEGKNRKI